MKKYGYSGVEDGSPINSIMGVQQAVHCLDLAGEIAADTKDVASLLQLARGWMEFGASVEDILPENPGGDDDDKTDESVKRQYGFNRGEDKSIIEKAGDNENGETGTDED